MLLPTLVLALLPAAVAAPVPASPAPSGCGGQGALSARLHGAVDRELVWQDSVMHCEGSLRPDGSGLRLTASGPLPGRQESLRILLGIAGARPGVNARNLAANLTLIVGAPGRIFATRGTGKCTVDELTQRALPRDAHGRNLWRVQARGFCVAPATTVDGGARILLSRFDLQTAVPLDGEGP